MPYTLLLVDDDRSFREEFKDSLEEYVVKEASCGSEALQILDKPNEIDLVILDVMLPGLTGTELLKKIKSRYPDLGIIILTGYSTKDIAIEALKGHADEYIEKPFEIRQIKEIIQRLLLTKKVDGIADDGSLDTKIERVKKFAQRNYHKKICLTDAAITVCLSPKYLSRVFKQKTGKDFSDYRLGIKISKAGELLKNTGYTVERIADELGYQNIESFTRIFKKFTGQTPTGYRSKSIVNKEKKNNSKINRRSKNEKKNSCYR